jgi:hypothetical protein
LKPADFLQAKHLNETMDETMPFLWFLRLEDRRMPTVSKLSKLGTPGFSTFPLEHQPHDTQKTVFDYYHQS